MKAQALILAAGAGTRMKSAKPKVAHEILGVPLVRWVVDAARAAGIDDVVAVLGHGADQVRPLVEGDVRIVMQERQLGTGDAVNAAREAFSEDGRVRGGSLVVLSGDCPLIKPETIRALIARREETDAAVVVLTMDMPDPTGYGRIVRAAGSDDVMRIVEQKDCTPDQAAITECNSGFYCFDAPMLFDALEQVGDDNAQGEYYLTDVLEICRAALFRCGTSSPQLSVRRRAGHTARMRCARQSMHSSQRRMRMRRFRMHTSPICSQSAESRQRAAPS